MTRKEPSKINWVYQKWPKGTVATLKWLNDLGVSSKLANWHVRSGWLEDFGTGAFIQPGDKVDWQGALYALQAQLGMTIHVGEDHPWNSKDCLTLFRLGTGKRFF